ncbi:BrnT family toxin [Teredinibacter haidensis]|uniref:BrnT family toxin n=1 Tax=Teredinibacter haidensis TaxID=2731755 RepID=UPI000948B241|nr:BrnT family toxin [Teredinibacter haidensis]
MLFDWDEEKRNKTLLERGIDFIDAAFVWEDPFRQERADERNNYGEKRIQTIGKVSFGILLVVYTERVREDGKEVIRIISVRKAGRKERKEYETRTFALRRIV